MNHLLSQKRMQREIPIAQFIPYSHHVTEHIIATTQGDYLSVWQIRGRSPQGVSPHALFSWIKELNFLLRGISSGPLSLWSHVIHQRITEFSAGEFVPPFCAQLNSRYQTTLQDRSLFSNTLYLTVILKADPKQTPLGLNPFSRNNNHAHKQSSLATQTQAIKRLTDINRLLDTTLKPYGADLLGTYTKNGHRYSDALAFLAFLVNGEHHLIPLTSERCNHALALNRPLFSCWGEIGEIRTCRDQRLFGLLEIADYDETTAPGQLNALLAAPYEFILTQSFSVLSTQAAKGFLLKHKQRLVDTRDLAYQQIESLDEALNQLLSGHFVMGEHHGTLLVWGKQAQEVREHLAQAQTAFLEAALITKVADLALEAGFWAQLPGNWSYRPRPMPITSFNFLSFSSLHNFPLGKPQGNPWGPALTVLRTSGNTPFYFNFHASPLGEDNFGQRRLGNTAIIGKSGTGKTVLLGFLLAQAQKYAPTVIVFDKDRGLEVAIRAMGGHYVSFKKGCATGFNPLQLDPNAANLTFLTQWIKALVRDDQLGITPAEEVAIKQALTTVMQHMDRSLRCLSVLIQSLPDPRLEESTARPSLHARLKKWCTPGPLAWVFDCAQDTLTWTDHTLYGFDVTEFLADQEIRAPLLSYLLFRTEAMLDGRRFLYVFDEFWKMLSDDCFEALAKDKQKTIRKENGLFIFATQEPTDALHSSIAKTLVQQCATWIFLPNPTADRQDYLEGFKLSAAEFEQLTQLGENSRQFLIKQADCSVVAELNLHGLEEELLILSGTPDRAALAESIRAELGSDDPAHWLPLFIQRIKQRTSNEKN